MTFRNTWAWGQKNAGPKPNVQKEDDLIAKSVHYKLGERYLQFSPSPGVNPDAGTPDIMPTQLYTENETNFKFLFNQPNATEFCKDAFHATICSKDEHAVNENNTGTKMGAWYNFGKETGGIPPGGCAVVRFKFSPNKEMRIYTEENGQEIKDLGIDEEKFDDLFELRRYEADEFYWRISPLPITADLRNIQRQAFAGMLWSKQYYHFIWDQWQNGDPNSPVKPPPLRAGGRNAQWRHMYLDDILSMPDCWEYPFFAAWDSAFHCIPLAMIDPEFAKKQLDVLTREWYMHPNGQV